MHKHRQTTPLAPLRTMQQTDRSTMTSDAYQIRVSLPHIFCDLDIQCYIATVKSAH